MSFTGWWCSHCELSVTITGRRDRTHVCPHCGNFSVNWIQGDPPAELPAQPTEREPRPKPKRVVGNREIIAAQIAQWRAAIQ